MYRLYKHKQLESGNIYQPKIWVAVEKKLHLENHIPVERYIFSVFNETRFGETCVEMSLLFREYNVIYSVNVRGNTTVTPMIISASDIHKPTKTLIDKIGCRAWVLNFLMMTILTW